MNVNKRYLNNILGFHSAETQQMGAVKEEENEEEEEREEDFNVRKYLDAECEKMLKEIQKKDKLHRMRAAETDETTSDGDLQDQGLMCIAYVFVFTGGRC